MRKLFWLIPFIAAASWGAVADCFVGAGTPENTFAEGDLYVTGDSEVDGVLLLDAAAAAPDDLTPTVAGGNILTTGVNTGATAITDLDDPIPGATYTIICGDITFPSTIADAGNFTLDGAWNPATVGDSITLYCFADNDYRETARGYAVAGPRQGDPFLAGPDAVGAPGYSWIANPTSGVYQIAADSPGVAVAGANVGTWDAAGYQGALGQTVPAAADVTTLTTTGQTDLNAGLVGAPSVAFTGSLTSGFYEVAADSPGVSIAGANVGTWDAAGYQGAVGGTTPAAGTFTNLAATGNFEYGQGFDELHNDYRRTETIKYIDGFDNASNVDYAVNWALTANGAGTNTIAVRPGWSEIVTGGAGGPDWNLTQSNGLIIDRAYAPRIEGVVDLLALGGQRFEFGFWAAGNQFVLLVYDTAIGNNWQLQVDDTTGPETTDTTVLVTVNPTKLEIAVTAAGVVTYAINGVAGPAGLIPLGMTANPHYIRWMETDIVAAAHTVAVDYVEVEKNKQ